METGSLADRDVGFVKDCRGLAVRFGAWRLVAGKIARRGIARGSIPFRRQAAFLSILGKRQPRLLHAQPLVAIDVRLAPFGQIPRRRPQHDKRPPPQAAYGLGSINATKRSQSQSFRP